MAKFDAKQALKQSAKEDSKLYFSMETDHRTAFLLVPVAENQLFIKYEQFQDPSNDIITFGRSILSMGPRSYFAKSGVTKSLGYPDGMTTCPIKELMDKAGIKVENAKKELVPARATPAWYCLIVPVAQLSMNVKGAGWTECDSMPMIKGFTVKKGKAEQPQLKTQIDQALAEEKVDFIVQDGEDLENAKCLVAIRKGTARSTVYTLTGFDANGDSDIKLEDIDLSEFLDVDELEEALTTAVEDCKIEDAYSNLLLSYSELETIVGEVSEKLGKNIELECMKLKRSEDTSSAGVAAQQEGEEVIDKVDPNELSDDSPF